MKSGPVMEITATAYQWWFRFEYPNRDDKARPTGGEAPLVTGNELVIPAGMPIRVNLRTVDVIHSFWVPKLAGKVDMIPNRANSLWFKADHPGYYYGPVRRGQWRVACHHALPYHRPFRPRLLALAR